jgi:multidrug efflux system membrane fusion protein
MLSGNPTALRRRLRAASALAIFSLASCVLAIPGNAQETATQPGVPVSVATIGRQDVPNWADGLGTVQAFYSVSLRTQVDGTLIAVPVKEGQDVKAGDLLALIDPRPYQATMDQASAKKQQDQAQLANAQADLARYSALEQRDFASRQQVATQTALVKQLTATIAGDDAQIEAARINLDFCRITAPFDARVGLRNVDPGNFVRASEATPIISVAQIQPISVTFTLPQDDLPAIARAMKAGQLEVAVFGSDDATRLDTGTLGTIDNSVDTTTGTIKLKASFPNQDRTLWPGQFVHVRLLLNTDRNVVAAPASAIQHGPDGLYVYRVDPAAKTVRFQPIKAARQEGDTYVVTDGLDPGAVVVTAGQSRLQDGTRIAINENKAPQQPQRSGT